MSQITTHILDTARGVPAEGVPLVLSQMGTDGWQTLAEARTNADGRAPGLIPTDVVLPAGTYKMHFATADYLAATAGHVFYPWVDVVFCLGGEGDHYHIPLLLSPFGYSTYRGS